MLIAAGVKVPKGVVVTADIAQIIMAGGVIVSGIEAGASIGSYASPTAAIMNAALDLMVVCGIAEPSSTGFQIAKYGTEFYMVASSGGYNVIADVAFALDTYKIISGFGKYNDAYPSLKAQADTRNKALVQNYANALITPQANAAAASLLKYQAGKSSIFEFMGETAERNPLVFYNYFPDMKVFLPPHFFQLTIESREEYEQAGSFFGIDSIGYVVKSEYHKNLESSGLYSRDQIIQAIVNYYLADTRIYNWIGGLNGAGFKPLIPGENMYSEQRVQLGDLACLSMFAPYFEKISDLDIAPILRNAGLTPYDLGYTFVEDMKTNFTVFPELKTVIQETPAITFNGVEYFSDYQRNIIKSLKSKQSLVDQLIAWDRGGNIDALSNNETGKKMLKAWGNTWGLLEDDMKKMYVATPEQLAATTSTGLKPVEDLIEPSKNIKNFISFVSFAQYMSQDKYLTSTTISKRMIADKIGYLTGLSADLDSRLKHMQFLSLGRKMNTKSLENIAFFFGTTADKIKLGPLEKGKLGYVLQ